MSQIPIKGKEKKEAYFNNLLKEGIFPPENPQGINRETIEKALDLFNKNTKDLVEVILALLDNKFPSLLNTPKDFTFADGASTADIGCYVGIWIRQGNKLDREGRDYWIKPLRDIGIIEPIEWNSKQKMFLNGHLTPKSPNAAYRLDAEFVKILKLPLNQLIEPLLEYKKENRTAERLKKQALAIEESRKIVGVSSHEALIIASMNIYAYLFLSGYEVCFQDYNDGDRISEKDLKNLNKLGINITLEDVWPDVILINKEKEALWFIEAVTSDGEVDEHKLKGFKFICNKSNKLFGGATTVYKNWLTVAKRQKTNKNLAINTYLWLEEDPTRVFWVNDRHNHFC